MGRAAASNCGGDRDRPRGGDIGPPAAFFSWRAARAADAGAEADDEADAAEADAASAAAVAGRLAHGAGCSLCCVREESRRDERCVYAKKTDPVRDATAERQRPCMSIPRGASISRSTPRARICTNVLLMIFFETKAKYHSKNADLPLLPRAPFSSLLLLQLLWLLSFQRACQRVSWH